MLDSATPWTIAHQAPLSMGFPRQEYWSGLPLPSPGDLPDPGITSASPALAGGFCVPEPPFFRQENCSGLLFPSPGDLSTQGSNPGLLHCRQILYSLSPQGSPSEKSSTSVLKHTPRYKETVLSKSYSQQV